MLRHSWLRTFARLAGRRHHSGCTSCGASTSSSSTSTSGSPFIERQPSTEMLLAPFQLERTQSRQTEGSSAAWAQWRRLERFLSTGQLAVIDGANGTEIQRRGGKPAETFSSGTAAMQRPDLCQEVHEAYLEAGANVIITHSYSSNRNVMRASGNAERATECILASSAIARRATAAHAAAEAALLAHNAAASNAAAAASMAAAATAAARATTSPGTNAGSEIATGAAKVALSIATEATAAANTAAAVAHACAASANAAAAASQAAAQGETLPPAADPLMLPEGTDPLLLGPPIVVGSLSTHPPEMPRGGHTSADAAWPEPEEEAAAYLEAAAAHGISGVDMLFLEMMKDREHAPRAVAAAATSGLPVFLGISARTDPATGQTVLWGTGEDAQPLTAEWFQELRALLGASLVGVNVMHTNFSTMDDTLRFVREDCGWDGALGAYPDHGKFEAPDWIFSELDNEEAVAIVERWVTTYDVNLLGGCCGLGPDFINAVSSFARRHNASVRETHKEMEQLQLQLQQEGVNAESRQSWVHDEVLAAATSAPATALAADELVFSEGGENGGEEVKKMAM